MSSDNPFLAGLSLSNRFTCPAAVEAYTLAKLSGATTLTVVGTGDADTDVAGIFLGSRRAGDNQGIPVCTQRGVLVPLLSDGADPLAVDDRVTISTVTAGRVALAASGGIGRVVVGAPAVADALALVLFEGATGSSGAGVYLPLAGGTMTGDITMPAAGQIESPNQTNYIAFYNSLLLVGGAGIRPEVAATTALGTGGYTWERVETKNIFTTVSTALTLAANEVAFSQFFHTITDAGGLLKTINGGASLSNIDGFHILTPTGAGGITWDATGNIGAAGAAGQYEPITCVWDMATSKWWLK